MRSLALIATLPLWVFAGSEADAGACGGVFTQFNFCRRCVTVQERTTSRDQSCFASMQTTPPTALARELILVSTKVSKQASNGRVSVSGNTYTYTPKKGFVGRDNFAIEWAFLEQGQVLVTFGQINMEVKP